MGTIQAQPSQENECEVTLGQQPQNVHIKSLCWHAHAHRSKISSMWSSGTLISILLLLMLARDFTQHLDVIHTVT